jgi:hypothetical protein
LPQDYVSQIRQMLKDAKDLASDYEVAIAEGMRVLELIRAERAQLRDQEHEIERLIAGAQSTVAFVKEISGQKPSEVTSEPTMAQSTVRPTLRVEAVVEAAMHLVEQGNTTLDVNDVESELRRRGIDLQVAYPRSVIGTVLARDDRFRKVRTGVFEWKAKAEPQGEGD